MDGPDLDLVRTLAARVVAQADQLEAERADDPEVVELAEAVASLAATVGALAAVLRDERKGN